MDDIGERVIRLLNEITQQEVQISEKTTFVGDLGFESIQVLQLVTAVERSFNLTIDSCDFERIRTVADLLAIIHEPRNQR